MNQKEQIKEILKELCGGWKSNEFYVHPCHLAFDKSLALNCQDCILHQEGTVAINIEKHIDEYKEPSDQTT